MANQTMYQVSAFIKAGAPIGGPATNLACFADPWVTLAVYKTHGLGAVRDLSSEVRKFRTSK